MTEVPEHLLRRSKERRAALGLDGGADAPAPAGPSAEPAGEAATAAEAPATPATPAAAPPAVVEPPPPPPPPPVPAYVTAAVSRPKVPRWAVPVLAVLPIWALIYAGTMTAGEAGITDPVLAEGQEIYSADCSACHGPGGEGGTGRPLNGGGVLQTFPDPQQHIDWVTDGSPAAGTPYGDPNRPGGQHVSQTDGFGAMPAFGTTLSAEEIVAVVRYEREIIGGETESALAAGGEAGAGTEGEGTEGEGAAEGAEGGELGAGGGGEAEGGTTTVPGDGDAPTSPPSTTAGSTGGNTGGTGGTGTPDTTTPETLSTTVAGG